MAGHIYFVSIKPPLLNLKNKITILLEMVLFFYSIAANILIFLIFVTIGKIF